MTKVRIEKITRVCEGYYYWADYQDDDGEDILVVDIFGKNGCTVEVKPFEIEDEAAEYLTQWQPS